MTSDSVDNDSEAWQDDKGLEGGTRWRQNRPDDLTEVTFEIRSFPNTGTAALIFEASGPVEVAMSMDVTPAQLRLIARDLDRHADYLDNQPGNEQ